MRLISKSERHNSKGCILKASDTIWNFREHFENKDAKKCIIVKHSETIFGTAIR